MPQANSYLSVKWSEEKAWEQLAGKIIDEIGVLHFRKFVVPSEDDWEAVDYLCQEYDYDFKEKYGPHRLS